MQFFSQNADTWSNATTSSSYSNDNLEMFDPISCVLPLTVVIVLVVKLMVLRWNFDKRTYITLRRLLDPEP